ncbi:ABC transporter permease [Achromobacter sp.]|uniref:ABC transporter permease n=1 Tax=Achromobacter sp. TaxID=134375 RepID=UPI003C716296
MHPTPKHAARQRSSRAELKLVAPLLMLMVLAFNLPLLDTLIRSFGWPHPTLAHYGELLGSPLYLKVIANTFIISALATLACMALGYPLAYWINGLAPRAQLFALALVVIPFWVSVLIRTYAWIILLGNAGIVNGLLQAGGLIDGPIAFLYNRGGVTLGVVNALLPFLVLPLYAAMRKVDPRLLHAARSLGSTEWTAFWRIFLPLTLPALAAGGLLVFLMALGFYVTPMILGGGRVPMLVNMLDLLINRMPDWNLASAISIALLLACLALYATSRRLGPLNLRSS